MNRAKKSVRRAALWVSGILVSLSGVVLQVHYHWIKSPSADSVMGLDRSAWNVVHIGSAIGFLVAVSLHLWAHRKWVRGVVIRRRCWSKHRVVLFLMLLTFFVIGSGFGSLCVSEAAVVELHDKVAIPFFLLVFAHAIRRSKRKVL